MANSLFDLTGKTALVTGSSRGIGYALAEGLAEAGARVILNGSRQDSLDKAVVQFQAAGLNAVGRSFDVLSTDAVKEGIADIEQKIGPLDILINNAGIQRRFPLLECSQETWQEVIDMNLTSVFRVGREVARYMVARGRGKIINICSLQSTLGRSSIAPYAASKGGVAMLTRNMCAEWAPANIQVNGIAPGYFKTELTKALVEDEAFSTWLCKRTPANRWGDVNELKGAAIYLASRASDFVNGHILYVDGGLSAVV
jgi:gluconate 5-dehydrogenase